jgi:hypothetical protein
MASSLPIPVFVAVKRRWGLRQYPRCSFCGFHDPEMGPKGQHIWTRDQANVECQLPVSTKLQYVWLEVGMTAPHGTTLDLYVNERLVVQQKTIRGRATVCARLPEPCVVNHLTLRLATTTFVPSAVIAGSDDSRQLGVALRAIVLGKRRTKYRCGTYGQQPLGARVAALVRGWMGRKAA